MKASKLGARIQRRREKIGWSRADLAAAIGTDRTLVYKWEKGVVAPSIGSLHKLCRMLRVTAEELLR